MGPLVDLLQTKAAEPVGQAGRTVGGAEHRQLLVGALARDEQHGGADRGASGVAHRPDQTDPSRDGQRYDATFALRQRDSRHVILRSRRLADEHRRDAPPDHRAAGHAVAGLDRQLIRTGWQRAEDPLALDVGGAAPDFLGLFVGADAESVRHDHHAGHRSMVGVFGDGGEDGGRSERDSQRRVRIGEGEVFHERDVPIGVHHEEERCGALRHAQSGATRSIGVARAMQRQLSLPIGAV